MIESSDEALLSRPIGRFTRGPGFLLWFESPNLGGLILAGHLAAVDIARALALIEKLADHSAFSAPLNIISDGRQLTAMDAGGFARFEQFVIERRDLIPRRIRRQAILHGGGMLGALMSGFNPSTGPGHDWRTFKHPGAGLAWLGRTDFLQSYSALASTLAIAPQLLALDRWLADHFVDGTLAVAANAVGLSRRSLQRTLTDNRTSFSQRRDQARVDAAKVLIARDDLKLSTVGERVGLRSPGHFTALFRRVTGMTPTAFAKLATTQRI